MSAPQPVRKVLVVEDEAVVALNLQERLEHLGYASTTRNSAGSAARATRFSDA